MVRGGNTGLHSRVAVRVREGSETQCGDKSLSTPERDVRCHEGLWVKERKCFLTCLRFLMTSVTMSEKQRQVQTRSFLHRGHHIPGPIDARAWDKNFCDSYQRIG